MTPTRESLPAPLAFGRSLLLALALAACAAKPGGTGPAGPMGPAGPTGAAGAPGTAGKSVVASAEPPGANCANGGAKISSGLGVEYVCNGAPGDPGPIGLIGPQGPTGAPGATGSAGPVGPTGAGGPAGPTGPVGATGPAAAALAFGYFYALMPPDNAATVASGAAVEFPRTGATNGISLAASGGGVTLPTIGVYEVSFQVSVSESGQLVLGLDGVEQANTVAGRATGTSQIANDVLVTTSVANTLLTVRNPAGSSTALTVTPLAGGTSPVSASLVVRQLQ
ncbi:MAG: collagen-like protein [Deltaproteobacteria bacterium]